jgi:hypothetical protein
MPINKVSGAIDPKAILTKERINKLVEKVKLEILEEIASKEKIELETLTGEYMKGGSESEDIKVEPPKKSTKIKFGDGIKG